MPVAPKKVNSLENEENISFYRVIDAFRKRTNVKTEFILTAYLNLAGQLELARRQNL